MRVISGTARGKALKAVPGQSTRPTTDKVKEAIFSMIGPYFEGGIVLDLFAGTGGLGIEALSRGMDQAIFVDMEKKSVETIHDNLKHTRLFEHAEVYRNEAGRAIKALSKRELAFDLIFLDPPYKLKKMDEWLIKMEEMGLLHEQTVVVIEHDANHHYGEQIGDGLIQKKRAEYGEIAVSIYTMREGHAPAANPIEHSGEEHI
ncbi:16S rRNA (guanine(966)-N(2))-methyltransferase RsmD [Marinicrinis sediminis]|uniref:16S rRNA (Guanine(966)-N(2))-methyltransferase RsmD n=1 Tax=Marinicrinis sediminis TaxID=1652465 RepID=A0ABW5R5X4_9BACL